MRDDLVLCLSRLLLAAIFLHEAVFLAMNFEAAAASMAKAGVSAPLLAATAVLQLGGGLALVLGWHTRLAAVALGLFCVATAGMFHANFAMRNEVLQFEKDLAIAGGMFALAVSGAGGWSLDGLFGSDRSALMTSAVGAPR